MRGETRHDQFYGIAILSLSCSICGHRLIIGRYRLWVWTVHELAMWVWTVHEKVDLILFMNSMHPQLMGMVS